VISFCASSVSLSTSRPVATICADGVPAARAQPSASTKLDALLGQVPPAITALVYSQAPRTPVEHIGADQGERTPERAFVRRAPGCAQHRQRFRAGVGGPLPDLRYLGLTSRCTTDLRLTLLIAPA
jgi:hypothetical protein